MPNLPDERVRATDAMTAYQMVSFLEGVVERGTATRAKGLGRPLAGKTGTSNDANDVWFVGFSPDLVVGVWFGFDSPRTLGGSETGGTVAVPVFRDVMAEALKDRPATPFRVPPGIKLVRVEQGNGRGYTEAFKPGQEGGGSNMIGSWPGGAPSGGATGGGASGGSASSGGGSSGGRPQPSLPGNSSSGGLY